MRIIVCIISIIFFSLSANGQVGIGETSFIPDESSVLEMRSTNKGVLIPRMNTMQRQNINSPAAGLMVYDFEKKSFWYYANAQWNEIRYGEISVLTDKDLDTEVSVETSPDKDEIDFNVKGITKWSMDSTSLVPRNSGGNILIGNEAGKMSDQQNRGTIAIGRRSAKSSVDRNGIIAIGDSVLIVNGTGGVTGDQAEENLGIGNKTLKRNTSGKDNVGVGSYAMEKNISGNNNVALGLFSLQENNDGGFNTAVGNKSLNMNLSGSQNVAIGMRSMESNQGGSFNVGVGRQALNSNRDASYNVAIGYNAMQTNETGEYNTAIGASSLQNPSSINQSIAIGYEAMKDGLSSFSLAIGNNSLMNVTTAGFNNTAIGHSALQMNTSGKFNLALGFESLQDNDTGSDNIGLGFRSLGNSINGSHNIGIGSYALENITTQDSIISIGDEAGRSTGVSSSIFVGHQTGKNIASGSKNLFIGHEVGNSSGTSNQNILIGYDAQTNSNGYENIVIGNETKGSNFYNTIIGHRAGLISTSSNNVLIGYEAGRDSLTGQNVAIGNYAGSQASSGQWNVFVGHEAGMGTGNNNTGIYGNVILGYQAGKDNMDDKNIIIGYQAGQNHQLGDNNIILGAEAGKNFQGSDQLIIESGSTSSGLILGDFIDREVAINWGISDAIPHEFSVNGEASKTTPGSWLGNSDARLKSNIEYLDSKQVLNQILKLRGAKFEWNDNSTALKRPEGKQVGFIAQDIQKIWPERVQTDPNGFLETSYGDFDPLMVEAIRALNDKVEKQQEQIDLLINTINDMKNMMSPIEDDYIDENEK